MKPFEQSNEPGEQGEFVAAVESMRQLAQNVKGIKPEKWSNLRTQLKHNLSKEEIDTIRGLASILENIES